MPAGRPRSRGRTSRERRSRRGCAAPHPLGRGAPRAARGRRDRDLDDRPRHGGRDRRGRPAPVGTRPERPPHSAPLPRSRGGDLLRPRRERAPMAGRRGVRGRAGDCIVHLADEEAHALKAGPDRPRRARVRDARVRRDLLPPPLRHGRGRPRRSSPPTARATCSRSTPRRARWRGPQPGASAPNRRRTRRRRGAPELGGLRGGRPAGDLWRPRPAPSARASTSAAAMPGMLHSSAPLPLLRGGALRHPRRLGHLHPGRRGAPASARASSPGRPAPAWRTRCGEGRTG